MIKRSTNQLLRRLADFLIRTTDRANTQLDHELVRYHDQHVNERCVIIGNGPSLTISDLDRLRNDVTFASNKIFLAFPETPWRPTYYVLEDVCVAEASSDQISNLDLTKFVSDQLIELIQTRQGTVFLKYLDNPSTRENDYRPMFSTDLANVGVYGGYSVVYIQMQLAYYMGFQKVYLVGMDHSFKIPDQRAVHGVYGSAIVSEGESNHFHPDYRKPGELWSIPQLERMESSFQMARRMFEMDGREILNATRQGHLELFQRVDFDSIFQ